MMWGSFVSPHLNKKRRQTNQPPTTLRPILPTQLPTTAHPTPPSVSQPILQNRPIESNITGVTTNPDFQRRGGVIKRKESPEPNQIIRIYISLSKIYLSIYGGMIKEENNQPHIDKTNPTALT